MKHLHFKKTLITIVALLILLSAYAVNAQALLKNDSSSTDIWFTNKTVVGQWVIGTIDHKYWFCNPTVTSDENNKLIEIKGDTIAAVQMLLDEIARLHKQINKQDSIDVERLKLISAAIDFTNQVPTRHEDNCKWQKYKRALKRNGYKITTLKTPKQPCK